MCAVSESSGTRVSGAKHSSKSKKRHPGSPRVVVSRRIVSLLFSSSPFSSSPPSPSPRSVRADEAIFASIARAADGRKNGGGGASVDRGAHGVFQSRRRVLLFSERRAASAVSSRARSRVGASAAVFSPGVVSSNTSSVSARVTRLNETVSVVRSTETPVTHERLVTERHGALAAPSPATIAAQTLEDDDADARSAAASPFGVASSPGLATPPSAFAASASSSATAVSSGSAAGSGGHVFSGSQDVFSSRRRVVARAEAFSFSFVARDFAADALDFGFFDLPGTRVRTRAAARGAS